MYRHVAVNKNSWAQDSVVVHLKQFTQPSHACTQVQ